MGNEQHMASAKTAGKEDGTRNRSQGWSLDSQDSKDGLTEVQITVTRYYKALVQKTRIKGMAD